MTRSSSTFSFRGFCRAVVASGRPCAGPARAFVWQFPRQSFQPRRTSGPIARSAATAAARPGGTEPDPGDLPVRLDRLEGALRQLTGTIEQLQYRNQQLESQLKRMQDDTEYRFQQMGGKGGSAPSDHATTPGRSPGVAPGAAPGNARPAAIDAGPPFRRVRSIATSGRAGCAAHLGKPGSHRGARTGQGTYLGRSPGWPRRRRTARSIDARRKRSRTFASRRTAANGAAAGDCRIRGADVAAGIAKRGTAPTSTQCGAGRAAARDTSAFGHAAGRVRHGLRLRPA